MTTTMILQARMTSSRLPGKVMRHVEGRTLLEWVIRASQKIEGVDVVCVAAPHGEEHEPVVQEAERLNAVVVRGSETDVLDRFKVAAEATHADHIMRVTTDCPLADPVVCADVLQLLHSEKADYACNNEPFTFPHGLDCEAFTRNALERAAREATAPYDREHVTPWIKREASLKRVYLHGPGGECTTWRWTVDNAEDLAFFEAVAQHLGPEVPRWQDVAAVLEHYPHYHDINRIHRAR
jgi:spore coat polysaccharide biosynthesis protein SpsF